MDRIIVLFCVFHRLQTQVMCQLWTHETLNFLSECGQNMTLSVSSLLFYLLDVVIYRQSQTKLNGK